MKALAGVFLLLGSVVLHAGEGIVRPVLCPLSPPVMLGRCSPWVGWNSGGLWWGFSGISLVTPGGYYGRVSRSFAHGAGGKPPVVPAPVALFEKQAPVEAPMTFRWRRR